MFIINLLQEDPFGNGDPFASFGTTDNKLDSLDPFGNSGSGTPSKPSVRPVVLSKMFNLKLPVSLAFIFTGCGHISLSSAHIRFIVVLYINQKLYCMYIYMFHFEEHKECTFD